MQTLYAGSFSLYELHTYLFSHLYAGNSISSFELTFALPRVFYSCTATSIFSQSFECYRHDNTRDHVYDDSCALRRTG